MNIPDQTRADVWLREFGEYVERGALPALEIMRLPNDHTAGAAAGKPTPRAYMADNDLALGRIIEALSHSPFWRDTAVFVVEDDAQAGPDHVDSHRSVLLMISAWNRGGVVHRFVEHDRRPGHDGGDPRPRLAVAVRSLRPSAARRLRGRSRT